MPEWHWRWSTSHTRAKCAQVIIYKEYGKAKMFTYLKLSLRVELRWNKWARRITYFQPASLNLFAYILPISPIPMIPIDFPSAILRESTAVRLCEESTGERMRMRKIKQRRRNLSPSARLYHVPFSRKRILGAALGSGKPLYPHFEVPGSKNWHFKIIANSKPTTSL